MWCELLFAAGMCPSKPSQNAPIFYPQNCQGSHVLKLQLSAKTAWEVLMAADSFQLSALRESATHAILVEANTALEERPAVSDELLHDVLSSNFLCISDEELLDLLLRWKEAEEGCRSKLDLIQKYVCLKNVPAEKVKAMVLMPELGFCQSVRLKRVRSVYTNNVLYTLRLRCEKQHGVFSQRLLLSNWVNVVHSGVSFWSLANVASQFDVETVEAGNWVEWKFPRFAVKLRALVFQFAVEEGTHFIVSCGKSNRGSMEEVFRSEEHGQISKGQVCPCECDFVANSLRVQVTSGTFNVCGCQFEGFLL